MQNKLTDSFGFPVNSWPKSQTIGSMFFIWVKRSPSTVFFLRIPVFSVLALLSPIQYCFWVCATWFSSQWRPILSWLLSFLVSPLQDYKFSKKKGPFCCCAFAIFRIGYRAVLNLCFTKDKINTNINSNRNSFENRVEIYYGGIKTGPFCLSWCAIVPLVSSL